MEYQIILSPKLELEADAFVSRWNDTPELWNQARTRLAEPDAVSYNLETDWVEPAVIVLVGFMADTTVEEVKALVKAQVAQALAGGATDEPPPVEVVAVRQPGGAVLLVVKPG